jgi:hypothetical protein
VDYKKYGLKFYTKTVIEDVKGVKVPKMLGVIEGPVNKMMKAYTDEFSFMRHQTKRDLRPSAKGKK